MPTVEQSLDPGRTLPRRGGPTCEAVMNGLVWRCAMCALGVAAAGALAFGGLVLAQAGTADAASTVAQASMSYDGGYTGGGGGTSGGTTIVVDKPAGGGS